jgi:hypothetical protein
LLIDIERFKTPIRHKLGSRVIQISVKNEQAYVSTSDGSIAVLEYRLSRLSGVARFQLRLAPPKDPCTDPLIRELKDKPRIRHIDIPNTPYILSCTSEKELHLLEELKSKTK